MLTANDFSQQMVAQARLLDPSFSGEIGTPERKLIDVVAQTLADNQIDLTGLSGALDIDSKYGTALDSFTALFGMQRQQAVAATGFVIFSRPSAAPAQIIIPQNVVVESSTTGMQYTTTYNGTIPVGQTTSSPVPVQAITTGSMGNTAANSITIITGTIVAGVTSVTNPDALSNGVDAEDDNIYKSRFKNTWARNLAGVEDQFLALALSGTYTTKAVALGLQSKYQEYMQVPEYDDAGYVYGSFVTGQAANGTQGNWTTALSTIPFAKQIYTNTQTFVSNGQPGATEFFYQPDIDFTFNVPAVFAGDAYRNNLPNTNLNLQPNFTFTNVYNPVGNPPAQDGLQALAPQSVVLTEFRYISTASRNDLAHNIDNAVDVYVNGTNNVQANCILLPRVTTATFNTTINSPWYYENYRRYGIPTKRPQLSNYITPLFESPIDGLPDSIVLNGQTYILDQDYWLVREVSPLYGSIRARDGIEWNFNTTGSALISAQNNSTPLEIENYLQDANIALLQATIEDSRQINTDVLVHQARLRYFKFDLTLMYGVNANYVAVNAAIGIAVQAYFDRQYFGTVIQLSDILEAVHEVQGVDNVRWSSDAPVTQVDINGNPLHGASIDRLAYGSGTLTEKQTLYIVGHPTGSGDGFVLSWPGIMTTASIPFSGITASSIQTAIQAVQPGTGIYHGITVTEDSRPATNVIHPIRSFTITYGGVGVPEVPNITNTVTQSDYTYFSDFFLMDDELPTLPTGQLSTDTVPGIIVRPRAQNTFARPGL